ncbi:hypothetical protein DFR52_101591 [Hoeflea marina]|uniref:Uncharacterized protein n=1 Tax=Hoeflea marina TaxID=274592 RepID=A0A317PR04_9HYPH|nr:hypothetical protein [Hoeflea marina]PWW03902.1 hypothetical protein DFR52_101591 [Hoeflea marina]
MSRVPGRWLPRTVAMPVMAGAAFGALAGLAAIRGRGSVDLGSLRLEGLVGVLAVTAILGGIGLLLGLIFWLIQRALTAAADGGRGR